MKELFKKRVESGTDYKGRLDYFVKINKINKYTIDDWEEVNSFLKE